MSSTLPSTVFAVHDADPRQSWSIVFRRAMNVGRDHIASTVNTLVLAYAGASITLLLLFSFGDRPVLEILNSEVVASEIVKTLVGSIGLIAAVPLTTALATTMAVRRGLDAGSEREPRRPRRGDDRDQTDRDELKHAEWRRSRPALPRRPTIAQRLADTDLDVLPTEVVLEGVHGVAPLRALWGLVVL